MAAVGFWEMFPIGFLWAPVTLRNQRCDDFKCKESCKGAEGGNKKEMKVWEQERRTGGNPHRVEAKETEQR